VVDARSVGSAYPEADALVADVPGVVCAIRTADCAPVAFVAGSGDAIGVAHAGWRGLRDGVIQSTVAALRSRTDSPIRAVLGPCIHVGSYEFGASELEELVARYGTAVRGRTRGGALALDMAAGVAAALAEVDVTDFDDIGIDTFTSVDHHSWRREHADGRNITYAWIEQ